MTFFKFIHLLAALIWVGGMFFAYVVLRPAAVEILNPPERLSLWRSVFRRFFIWVWIAIVVLLVSGLYMIYLYGGMQAVPPFIHAMLALGLLMIVIYSYVFFACYSKLSLLVSEERWKEAGDVLGRIRKLVLLNLLLGLITIAVAKLGL